MDLEYITLNFTYKVKKKKGVKMHILIRRLINLTVISYIHGYMK